MDLRQTFSPFRICSNCLVASIEKVSVPQIALVWKEAHCWGVPVTETVRNRFGDGRELVLPPSRKLATVLEVAAEVRRCKMTFGAADNEFQHLSDTGCCCSGVDRFHDFENYFKHQIGYAIRRCVGKTITYSTIQHEWAPSGSVDRFLNSKSRIAHRNKGRATMIDHIKLRWNQQGVPGSPSSFFGVKVPNSAPLDLIAYEWDTRPQNRGRPLT